MRGITRLFVSLGAVALLTTPALAQRGGGGGMMGMMGNPAMLLMNKGVQQELKLSDDQAEKAQSLARDKMQSMREKFQALSQEERQEKGPAMMREMAADVKKSAGEILKPEQMKRLDQIELQQRGPEALTDPEVQKKLALTDDQQKKVKDIREDAGRQMRELFQGGGGFNEETRKKMTDLRKETRDKSMAVLTSEQKKTWDELTGEPFEVRFERPGGGR